jgi:transposase-like protein
MLQAHSQSGLSQEAFCRREGVSTTSLSNWRKRLGTDSVSAMAAGVMPSPFIELANPVRPLDAGVKVRIELGAGIVLELSRA